MKKNIHPAYHDDSKIICECGNVVIAGSTMKEIKTEICGNCHPFYTGKQKLVDTAGRVEKFEAQRKKAQNISKPEITEKEDDDKSKEKGTEITMSDLKKMQEKKKKEEEAAIIKAEKRAAGKKKPAAKPTKKEEEKAEVKAEETPAEEPKEEATAKKPAAKKKAPAKKTTTKKPSKKTE